MKFKTGFALLCVVMLQACGEAEALLLTQNNTSQIPGYAEWKAQNSAYNAAMGNGLMTLIDVNYIAAFSLAASPPPTTGPTLIVNC